MKVSSPHWTISGRLYFILQDLYSAQVTVHAQSDSLATTFTSATPQDRSGSESRSDKASSSGTGHSPMFISSENVRIDHTTDHQHIPDADTALIRKRPLALPAGYTASNVANTTTFGDYCSDEAAVQGSSGIGFGYKEAGQGRATALSGSSNTKRPLKKVKKMPPLSRTILPRPLIPGASETQQAPEESLGMASATSASASSSMAPQHGLPPSTSTSTTILVPPGHILTSPLQSPLQPLPLQVQGQNNRHQPLLVPTSLHSLDTPPHLLPNLEFIDSRSLVEPMSTLPPPLHHGTHSHSRGQGHQCMQTTYPRLISSGMTAISMANELSSSSSFNMYEQGRATATMEPFASPAPPLSGHVSIPFDPNPATIMDTTARGYPRQPIYAPPIPSTQWNVEVVGSYPSAFETHSRPSIASLTPPSHLHPSLHSHPDGVRLSLSSGGEGRGGGGEGESVFTAGIPTRNEWTMDQDMMFGDRATPWPAGIVHERVGAREGMIEYQRLQEKQQEYMSTRFMRQLPVVELGTNQPPLTTLSLDPQQGGYGSSASGGGGSDNGEMHSIVEKSSSSSSSSPELAPFVQQPRQQSQQHQATHLQYPVHGTVMQPPIQRSFQLHSPQYQSHHRQPHHRQPHYHQQHQQQQQQQLTPPQTHQQYSAQVVSKTSQSFQPPPPHPPPPHY